MRDGEVIKAVNTIDVACSGVVVPSGTIAEPGHGVSSITVRIVLERQSEIVIDVFAMGIDGTGGSALHGLVEAELNTGYNVRVKCQLVLNQGGRGIVDVAGAET